MTGHRGDVGIEIAPETAGERSWAAVDQSTPSAGGAMGRAGPRDRGGARCSDAGPGAAHAGPLAGRVAGSPVETGPAATSSMRPWR